MRPHTLPLILKPFPQKSRPARLKILPRRSSAVLAQYLRAKQLALQANRLLSAKQTELIALAESGQADSDPDYLIEILTKNIAGSIVKVPRISAKIKAAAG